mgnify:FL=1
MLQQVLNRRILFLKFFIKQPLIWAPPEQQWWTLDSPFIQRYLADYLDRHPEARDQDQETTRSPVRTISERANYDPQLPGRALASARTSASASDHLLPVPAPDLNPAG